jgi:hypothetical protein
MFSKQDDDVLNVLESYAVATPEGNDQTILRQWIERFPSYEGDLIEFAASRELLKHDLGDGFESSEEKSLLFSMSRVAFDSHAAAHASIPGIVLKAEQLGLKKKDVRERLGISNELLTYLEDRRIEYSSIPKAFIENIADFLKTNSDSVIAFLSSPPRVANAFHKNEDRPSEPATVDFRSAVKDDLNLTEEQRKQLLSL